MNDSKTNSVDGFARFEKALSDLLKEYTGPPFGTESRTGDSIELTISPVWSNETMEYNLMQIRPRSSGIAPDGTGFDRALSDAIKGLVGLKNGTKPALGVSMSVSIDVVWSESHSGFLVESFSPHVKRRFIETTETGGEVRGFASPGEFFVPDVPSI